MALQNRQIVLKWIHASEGGYVDNPKDPGGATNFGVTQAVYNAWRRGQGLAERHVRSATRDEADTIFGAQYLDPIRFDDLPSGLDYALADYTVNSGARRAVSELQSILGVTTDGIVGAMTLDALRGKDVPKLVVQLCEARIAFMKRARHRKTGALLWDTFGRGWQRRVMGNIDGVQTDDIGVIDRAVRMARTPAMADTLPAPMAAPGKATEPQAIPAGPDALTGAGGLVAVAGGILGSLAGLHPAVQGLAVLGMIAVAFVLYRTWRERSVAL